MDCIAISPKQTIAVSLDFSCFICVDVSKHAYVDVSQDPKSFGCRELFVSVFRFVCHSVVVVVVSIIFDAYWMTTVAPMNPCEFKLSKRCSPLGSTVVAVFKFPINSEYNVFFAELSLSFVCMVFVTISILSILPSNHKLTEINHTNFFSLPPSLKLFAPRNFCCVDLLSLLPNFSLALIAPSAV